MFTLVRQRTAYALTAFLAASGAFLPVPATAQITAFKQAVAEAAASNDGVATYYREANYEPIWTGEGDVYRARRAALIDALSRADLHGLPSGIYRVDELMRQMEEARTVRDLGMVEAALSNVFISYANDLQSGLLTPARIDSGLVRQVERRPAEDYLSEFAGANPRGYLAALAPNSTQYQALLKQKMTLERLLNAGGWGEAVPVTKLEPGDTGPAVLALRNRLVAMGYMKPTASGRFDDALRAGVLAFQTDHGLEADGVAGKGTITELNKSVADRLKSVVVAMERERWLPQERGGRHILVNQTDFSAKIVDQGRISFETRAVIGKNVHDRRSPEFSDQMEHMVINPSWYVPRSIITKEYLPKLAANPNAVSHLEITDRRGRRVNRGAVDFSQFSARSFPFAMRQPPGKRNALGLVKFMFPNKYNIYLHDTPQKSLFSREVRAFSHGCIRLADPFDFAYALLARQEENPKAFFHRMLNTGKETKVVLDQPVPVHLIYRTAFIGPRGAVQYRRDVYGRDKKIWEALNKAGVALPAVQG
ncbi:MAG: murein L,D-transpeptidase [Ruegeria sp.]|uniref:L,D-transpeptidase family protein n=1 Tax=Ruegeria sp. TaxID=1879320 RepID=UPI00349E512F